MDKNSSSKKITQALSEKGATLSKYQSILKQFFFSVEQVLREQGKNVEGYTQLFLQFIDFVKLQIESPYQFEPYHERIRKPFDYYQFGLDFLRPLVDMPHSSLVGKEHLKKIAQTLSKGHNVIFFANHQIEADPQAISLLLENSFPKIGEKMIFVAGERVLIDPLAIPFSMGRNLLCIYSKKYIDNPPEDKLKKQLHNKKTMALMSKLLSKGGQVIYVAPSGGRDRKNAQGILEVAPFDPKSIEMFYLMTKKAKKSTHFYPLALSTHFLLPPPQTVQVELGESRITKGGAIHLAFGEEIDMENVPGSDAKQKEIRRKNRADYICNLVREAYNKFPRAPL